MARAPNVNRMLDDRRDLLEELFESGRANAILSWVLVGLFSLVLLESVLDWDRQWMVFTTALLVIVLIPPASQRSPLVMLPWELLAVAAVPVVARALELSQLTNDFATYLAIAAVALIVVTELHVLARVHLTHWFAIVLVMLATLAVAAAWAIIRWLMDQYLDTAFIPDSHDQDLANEALMIEFGWVLVAGLVAGVLFDLYFRRRARRLRRSLGWVIGR